MVYKKYIKRGGKVFGPYYYESYRVGDKVKTRFISKPKMKYKIIRKISLSLDKNKIKTFSRNLTIISLFALLAVVGILVIFLVTLQINNSNFINIEKINLEKIKTGLSGLVISERTTESFNTGSANLLIKEPVSIS